MFLTEKKELYVREGVNKKHIFFAGARAPGPVVRSPTPRARRPARKARRPTPRTRRLAPVARRLAPGARTHGTKIGFF